jgi:hypothetical protein
MFNTQSWVIKNICIFINCISSRNTFSWRTVAEDATESGKVVYVMARNMKVNSFEDRRAIYSTSKNIYKK